MKIHEQVCTLEQSQKLLKLGVKDPSVLVYRHWRGNGQVIIDFKKDKYFDHPGNRKMYNTNIICNAYTVAELGAMLIDPNDRTFVHTQYNYHNGLWEAVVNESVKLNADSEAQARAEILIYLIESGLDFTTSLF